jgi:hypothetical protein
VARPTAPPPPSRIGASTQEKILELSATRPLYQLQLTAITPAAAAALTGAAQPLGADTLWLSITVGGTLKDGGSVDFRVSEVKPNHAIRPLSIAQTIFQAVQDGSTYETMLHLEFSPPRPGMGALLKSLIEGLPEGVSVRAEFDRP